MLLIFGILIIIIFSQVHLSFEVSSSLPLDEGVTASYSPSSSITSIPTLHGLGDPKLESFDFDASQGLVTLFFNTFVDAGSFRADGVGILLGNETFSISSTYNNVSSQGNHTQSLFFYLISRDYARFIFMSHSLNESLSSFRMTLSEGTIMTTSNFVNVGMNSSQSIPCSNFKIDSLSPFLSSYNLDMNNGTFSLHFSKPIDPNTISLQGLAFQSQKNALLGGIYVHLSNKSSEILSISEFNTKVIYSLGRYNLNLIRSQISLCVSKESTYLSGYLPFVKDLNSNNVSLIAFDKSYGINPKVYLKDISSPILESWDLDMNKGHLILKFSKTIHNLYVNYQLIHIYANQFSQTHLTLSRPSKVQNFSSDVITVFLDDDMQDNIKANKSLCYRKSNCYLILENDVVSDTALIQNSYVGKTSLYFPVTSFIPDNQHPTLNSFTLNLTSKQLILYFDEVVDLTSIKYESLSLLSSESLTLQTESITFHRNNIFLESSLNSKRVVFNLSNSVYNYIKDSNSLGRSVSSTFIAMQRTFVTDCSIIYNMAMAISKANALMVSNYFPDYIPPKLLLWTFNESSYQLQMIFSEPVNVSSFNVTAISLTSDETISDTTLALQLTSSSYVTTSMLHQENIVIQLGNIEISELRSSQGLCTSTINCFMTTNTNLGFDTSTFLVDAVTKNIETIQNQILPVISLAPMSYTKDLSPPVLLQVNLNLTSRVLELVVNKPVEAYAANISAISISIKGGLCLFRFSNEGSYVLETSYSSWIHIYLGLNDMLGVKACFSEDGTFIHFDPNFLIDGNGNALDVPTHGMQCSSCVNQLELPSLLAWQINSTNHVISMYFDDIIVSDSIHLSNFQLFNSLTKSIDNLQGALMMNPKHSNTSMIPIDVSGILLKFPNLLTSSNDFQVSIAASSFHSFPLKLSNSFISSLRPGNSFSSFTLNMTSYSMDLEVVIPLTSPNIKLSPNSFMIQLVKNKAINIRLTGIESFQVLKSGMIVRIYFNNADVNAIHEYFDPLTSFSEIQITTSSNAMEDEQGYYLSASQVLICSALSIDRNKPLLTEFILDMNAGYIILTFSKLIQIESIDMSKLLLKGSLNSTIEISLASASFVYYGVGLAKQSVASLSISLNDEIDCHKFPELLNSNTSSIKTLKYLLEYYRIGVSKSTSHLVVHEGFVGDTSIPMNFMSSIPIMKANAVVADQTPPSIISFSIDMNRHILTILFTKQVKVSSNNVYSYFLISNVNNYPDLTYQLQDSKTLHANDSHIASSEVSIQLGAQDVNAILLLSPNLCFSLNNCFLGVNAKAISDLSGNYIQRVYFRYAIPCSYFIKDSSGPFIVSSSINLNEGFLDVLFNKRLNCSLTQVDRFTLQYSRYSNHLPYSYSLSSQSSFFCRNESPNMIHIILATIDLIKIKATPKVVKEPSLSFLLLREEAVYDLNGNPNVLSNVFEASPISFYIPDVTSPRILSFLINSQGILQMFFNEPMSIHDFDVHGVSLQTNANISHINPEFYFNEIYQLEYAKVVWSDEYQMEIHVNLLEDYSSIYTNTILLTNQSTLYLSLTSKAISDVSGNAIESIEPNKALNVGPAIVSWDLNLNNGSLTLVYSKTIASPFSMIGLMVSNLDWFSSYREYIFHSSLCDVIRLSSYLCKLSDLDLNYMKQLFGTSQASLYEIQATSPNANTSTLRYALSLSSPPWISQSLLDDNYQLNYQTVVSSNVITFSFTPDISRPKLLSFDLDLNQNLLLLTFNEVMDPSLFHLGSDTKTKNIVLVSSSSGKVVMLSLSSITQVLMESTNLILVLDFHVAKLIKLDYSQGHVFNNLFIDSNLAYDYSGNSLIGNRDEYLHPYLIHQFINDTSPPHCISITLDLEREVLVLSFDEYVNLDSLQASDFMLIFTMPQQNQSSNFSFSSYTILLEEEASGNWMLDMSLYRYDAWRLHSIVKTDEVLEAKGIRLRISKAIPDVFGNVLMQDSFNITSLISFNATTSRLMHVLAFDGSYVSSNHSYLVNIYFSEIIDLRSFHCHEYILIISNVSLIDTSLNCFVSTLSNSSIISYAITLALGSHIDDKENVYLYTTNIVTTSSIFRQSLQVISRQDAILVGPRITNLLLDLNDNEMIIMFSKPLCSSNFQFVCSSLSFYSDITKQSIHLLHNEDHIESISYPFDISNQLLINSTNVSSVAALVSLTSLDSSRLKIALASTSTSTSISNHWYYYLTSSNCFHDEFNRSLVPIRQQYKRLGSYVFPDVTAPLIVSLGIDMGLGQLAIGFNEPILLNSFDLTAFAIQSHRSIGSSSGLGLGDTPNVYEFTSNGLGHVVLTNQVDNTSHSLVELLTITLSSNDINNLKVHPLIGRNLSSCFMSWHYNAIKDVSGNAIIPMSRQLSRPFDSFVQDTIPPILQSFQLDMSLNILTLDFSEPIRISSIQFNAMIIQSRYGRVHGSFHQLTIGRLLTTLDSSSITLMLSSFDVKQIKLQFGLARSKVSTYLTCSSTLALDVSGNALIPIVDNFALPCTSYIANTIAPHVISTTMDLDNQRFLIQLSDVVQLSYINVSKLSFTSHPLTKSYSLSSLSFINYSYEMIMYSSLVSIDISLNDMNHMKVLTPLLLSTKTTLYSFGIDFIFDVFSNSLQPQQDQEVSLILKETIPSKVLYKQLDMNQGSIVLVFDKVINPKTLNTSQWFIQSNPNQRSAIVINPFDVIVSDTNVNTNTNGNGNGNGIGNGNGNGNGIGNGNTNSISISISTNIQLILSSSTLDFLKFHFIGIDLTSCFITWTNLFLQDYSGLFVSSEWDASVYKANPKALNTLQRDEISPHLVQWYLNDSKIILVFDEPVDLFIPKDNNAIFLNNLSLDLSLMNVTYDKLNTQVILPMNISMMLMLNDISYESLSLTIVKNTFADRSLPRNYLKEVIAIPSQRVNCNPCPNGFYTSSPCTLTSNRICSRCSSCGLGRFIQTSCGEDGLNGDTHCQLCSTCPLGTFISSSCLSNTTHDTICSLCTTCKDLEFHVRKCQFGLNAICDSCQVCEFLPQQQLAKEECESKGSYHSWKLRNCCENGSCWLVDRMTSSYSSLSNLEEDE